MTFTTTEASSAASTRLSPSRTNCSRHAVGILQPVGIEDKILLVKPPPGMNGISGLLFDDCCGCCCTGELYVGIGSERRLASDVASKDALV